MAGLCYKLYIKDTLKSVSPNARITASGLATADELTHYLIAQLLERTNRVRKTTGAVTVSSRQIQSAVRLLLRGDLAANTISEAAKHLAKISTNKSSEKSVTKRAGLIFPPSRMRHEIKALSASKGCKCRVSLGAAVYLAGAVEYIVSEILAGGAIEAENAKAKTVNSHYIHASIAKDAELDCLFKNVIFTCHAGDDLLLHVRKAKSSASAAKKSVKRPAKKSAKKPAKKAKKPAAKKAVKK